MPPTQTRQENPVLSTTRKVTFVFLLLVAASGPRAAAAELPFFGIYHGQAVSAGPTPNPAVIFVTTEGEGRATQLGRFQMVSPHFSDLMTLEAWGTQQFTAANGDTLTADFEGQFVPVGGGFLSASIECTITGGTGRFAGATGSYTFDILFDTATLWDAAIIQGTISVPGR
jgi:hypothetical protein